ncbi:kinase-like domain-containing protein [Dactylonectria macrodidyma]|uniref:non-specific serine/threonine protein kinase n=1 Tax=Dactylonectria macrodidyma TaxID=307937 RepID=A0A9P9DVM8_9HYPO|nr:kinase-like domain-containing protein [Dactylonectria macrodidyma]
MFPSSYNRAHDRSRETLDSFIAETISVLQPQHVHSYKSMECLPYEVDHTSEIGRGAFGTVQKVTHRQTGRPLAMKSFEEILSVSAKKSILQEIVILKHCHHPNIVRFVEAVSLEGTAKMAIIIEPWAPYTLWKFLANTDAERKRSCPWFDPASPQSTQIIFRIMHDIVLAIVHLHGRSIKHKDLKPENILLFEPTYAGITPLITDVGISKLSFHGAPTNFTKSTYQFLAPEQVRHEESTLKADVWQLGCCFALLLAVAHGGCSAFRQLWGVIDSSTSSCQVAEEHPRFTAIFKKVYRRGDAQGPVFELIAGMLDVDPSKRLAIDRVETMVQSLIRS